MHGAIQHLALCVVPATVERVSAAGAVTSYPKLAVEEGVLLLAVDLLAVVAEEPTFVV